MGLPFRDLLNDFDTSLRARRRSPRTRQLYRTHSLRLADWLDQHDHPSDVDAIDNRILEEYFAHLATELRDTTAAMHYRSIRSFFSWLEREEEIGRSPFTKMSEPKVVDRPPDVLRPDEIERLLAACKGPSRDYSRRDKNLLEFTARRDRAIIMVFYDSGVRLGELVSMTTAGFDSDHGLIQVIGKTGPRVVPVGDRTLEALNRYLRVRRSWPGTAGSDALWIGREGPLTDFGVGRMLKRRGQTAGVENLNPHRFRHTFAHQFLTNGGRESDLQLIAGWTSGEMVRRYGRSAAFDRAVEAHRSLSPGDRLK